MSVGPRTILILGAVLSVAGRAHAELGGPLSSVAADGGRMSVKTVSTPMGPYTRHDLTRANGGMVHELTNAQGQVFGVSWSGPGKPDLRTLLGPYFETFQAANTSAGGRLHTLRRPPQVNQTDLQIQTAGHMGWFHGVAFVPSLAPPGFSPSDLPNGP